MSESDQWDRIWSPHRQEYLEELTKEDFQCPFCSIPKLSDAESFILARGEHSYAVLNRYPYNAGHILVCTYRHIGQYLEITPAEHEEILKFTQNSIKALKRINNEVSFNIGINQGRVAGAGIPDHFHQHIVPRWRGDSNFMPVIGATRVLSQMLSQTQKILERNWG